VAVALVEAVLRVEVSTDTAKLTNRKNRIWTADMWSEKVRFHQI